MTTIDETAWANQSKTLIEVQRYGSNLEREVRNALDWDGGRIIYDSVNQYRIQVDCAWPSLQNPKVIASVTYSDPDTPGHSNENKLQLKLGELVLLKNQYPDLKAVLVLGGTQEAWLPYVLQAFDFFYDTVICLWRDDGLEQLRNLSLDPSAVVSKHLKFWQDLRTEWRTRGQNLHRGTIPNGLVRYGTLDALKAEASCTEPRHIKDEIARYCMQASMDGGGTEWEHYKAGRWAAIEMSRSFFNPQEAIVELSLKHGRFHYEGGIARDIEVPSLLHKLGMMRTKLSEDFVLFSERLDRPVYLQCKASGGGRLQHGKNIQNRTKEQVARGVLYSSALKTGRELQFLPNSFHWISILDGNWGVTRREQYKYLHMLQMAGYDKFFSGSDLLGTDGRVLRRGNPLVDYLNHIGCRKL